MMKEVDGGHFVTHLAVETLVVAEVRMFGRRRHAWLHTQSTVLTGEAASAAHWGAELVVPDGGAVWNVTRTPLFP